MKSPKNQIILDEGYDLGMPFELPEIIIAPSKYVDGVHVREVMNRSEYPVKIQVHSTGQILYVYGFHKDGMVYTSQFNFGGVAAGMRGTYYGKLGEDFIYL